MSKIRFKKWSFRLNKEVFFLYLLPSILSLGLVFFFIFPICQALQVQKNQIHREKALLKKLQRKIKGLEISLAQEPFDPAKIGHRIFVGQDPYVFVSEIQQKVETIPELTLRSFRLSRRQKVNEYLEKANVTLSIAGDTKGLVLLLKALEQEKRAIRLTRLSVIYQRIKREEKLNLTLNVEGLFSTSKLFVPQAKEDL